MPKDMINKVTPLFFLISTFLYSQVSEINISGTVTDVWETPIPDVTIVVKGTDRGTVTDKNGAFKLLVNTGEVLKFSSLGYGNAEIKVSGQTKTLQIILVPKATQLDEVTVEQKKEPSQSIRQDSQSSIKTARGMLSKKRSSSFFRIVDGSELTMVGYDFLTSLQNHVPKMRVVRPPAASSVEVYLSRISYASIDTLDRAPKAIFDVDGFIQEEAPTYLSSADIAQVAILERNSAISRYGSQGLGGVIVINTKAQGQMEGTTPIKRYDNMKLLDSISELFDGKTYMVPSSSERMKPFWDATDKTEIFNLIEAYDEKWSNDPYINLDLAYFLRERWGEHRRADTLLQNIRLKFSNEVAILRAVAYRYDILGKTGEALQTFHEILKLDPLSAQSYFDVAKIYREQGNYKKAKEIYTRYRKERAGSALSYDEYGSDILMSLASTNNSSPKKRTALWDDFEEKAHIKVNPTRIVAKWNDPDIALGFQIVNPESVYSTWTNAISNEENYDGSLLRGYSSTQFFIDEQPKGDWQLNLGYFKGHGEHPAYVYVVVYFDYGLDTQHQEERLFKLTSAYEGYALLTVDTLMKKLRD
ncbi:tetratricopeptide repeat protein [Pareuzebyella sediminis]|uniref:tetratricopeptide repeat protein n=1 Tax=Pareuzebyella sediminis TaxID=2607998 RepID=UPI0011EFBF2D|nr:tetratricopeptide repeat protein [Pareuzebyella sediminis]